MKKYEFFEHTADIGINSYGKTIEEAFENSALAITNIITNTEQITEKKEVKINTKTENLESLLYEWLEEIIIQFDMNNLIFSKFQVKINENNLNAICSGEKFDKNKHKIGTEVKAITYHMMDIKKINDKWQITFVPDI